MMKKIPLCEVAASCVLAALVLAYAIVFSTTSVLAYRNFGMSAYDVGIHDQAIWKLATGRGLFNTVRGLPIWGDHCWFIIIFLAPLYWIAPRLETALVAQSVALAAAAIPLAILARRRIGSWSLALMLACAWLLSPALQNMNLENFHPEVIAAPLLLWALERADAGRWKGYWIATGLALICKEDVAITVFFVGLWLLACRNRRMGLATMGVSVAWFLLCIKFFLPVFNRQGFFRFSGGYWFSSFWQEKWNLDFYRRCIGDPRVAAYAWRLGFPILFAAVLYPPLLLAAAPGFIVNVLSRNSYLISIDYHYNYHVLPMLFAATAIGLGWLEGHGRSGRMAVWLWVPWLLAASLCANDRWSHLPVRKCIWRIAAQWRFFRHSGTDERFWRVAASLPESPDVPIACSHNLLPHLAHRNEVYMFPNPWRAAYWGIAGEGLPSPDRVRAIIIDRNALGPEAAPIFRRLITTGEFEIVAEEGPLLVARRQPRKPREALINPLLTPPPERGIKLLVFHEKEPVTSLKPLAGRTPDLELTTETIQLPLTAGRLNTAEGIDVGASDNVRLIFIGRWRAKGASALSFRVQADDGCRLYLNGKPILDYDGVHGMSQSIESQPVQLTPGDHTLTLDYFEWGGDAGLRVEWRPKGSPAQWQPLRSGDTLP